MAFQEKQLGQVSPAATTVTQLYSPASSTTTVVKSIVVANTSGSADTYRVFNDDNGTTRSTATALYYDVSLAANTTVVLSVPIFMDNSSGEIAVESNGGNITFTAYGAEIT